MRKNSPHKKDTGKVMEGSAFLNDHLSKTFLGIGSEWNNLIINASPDFIYSYDTAGRFTSANHSLCRSMNMNADQIVGKTNREIGFPEAQCIEWEEMHAKVYQTDAEVVAITSTVMPDGKVYFYKVILNPLHDSNGKIMGIGGITRDITDYTETKEALRDSRAEFYSLVDNAPDIIGIHTASTGQIDHP